MASAPSLRLALAALVACAALSARAAPVAFELVHQGRLLDGNDAPVNDPGLAMKFAFFANSSKGDGETPLWTSGECRVPVSGGQYSVLLGAGTAVANGCGTNLTTEVMPLGTPRYLEVSIGSTILGPRLRLGAVPWAMNASAIAGLSLADLDARYIHADGSTVSLADLDARYVHATGATSQDFAGPVTAGSLSSSGDVRADGHFVGDGSGLVNVPAESLTGTIPASALGNAVLTIGADSPLAATRTGTTVALSLARADATTDGYLAGTDFANLSGKLDVVQHDATLTGLGTAASPLSLAFGAGPTQAVAGNDARLGDARVPRGSAGGDLAGTYPNPSVAALQGHPVAATAPAAGQLLQWDGTAWAPTNPKSTNALAIPAVTNATPGQYYTSQAITLSGTGVLPVVVTGDATATLVRNGTDSGKKSLLGSAGDTLAIRMRAPAATDDFTGAILSVDANAGAFVIATASDTTPDAFSFTDVNAASLNVDIVSNAVTITGISTTVPASVTGDATALLVKNGTATSASTTVSAGDSLSVQVKSASTNSATKTLTITVGASSVTWKVTTVAQCTSAKSVYASAGSNTLLVPTGCTKAVVKLWGAGGGGGSAAAGGGGGFVSGTLTVTPGETLTVVVGGAGGFVGGPSTGGGGGGGSGIRRGGTRLAVAGGGGGGGSYAYRGGAGGGTTGQQGEGGSISGGGGTQSAGGSAGSGGRRSGNPGSGANGGDGVLPSSNPSPGGAGDGNGGVGPQYTGDGGSGGGGGGYFGGGSGGGDAGGFAGGGGSGLVPAGGSGATGTFQTPGGTGDADYVSTAANGGAAGAAGQAGRIVVQFQP